MRRRTGFVQIKRLLNKVAARKHMPNSPLFKGVRYDSASTVTVVNGLLIMLVVANNLVSFFATVSHYNLSIHVRNSLVDVSSSHLHRK